MSQYNLSSAAIRIINLRNKLDFADVSLAKQSEIDAYNRSELRKKRYFKNLYRPVEKTVSVDSFIIPVADNASVAGYLFKQKDGMSNSTNSLIVYFHDGGWVLGNVDKYSAFCSNLCNQTSSAVLAVDYRLAPLFRFPVPVEDCYSAYLWAQTGTKYWKLDPSKVYLMGIGAGANLAIAVARIARDTKGPKPAGMILYDPLTDCRLRTGSIEKYKDSPTLSAAELNFFIKSYQREPKDILDPLFSPLLAKDHSRLAPTIIFSSEYNPLSDDAVLFNEALKSADTVSKLFTLRGAFHAEINYPDSDRWENVMRIIATFVKGTHTGFIDVPNIRHGLLGKLGEFL